MSSSDSLFSLIIFIYVAVTFCYIFYAFCWRETPRKELSESERKVCFWIIFQYLTVLFVQDIPMITEQLSQVGEEKLEKTDDVWCYHNHHNQRLCIVNNGWPCNKVDFAALILVNTYSILLNLDLAFEYQ